MNFATAEAFKLLRTNISFSIPEENTCRVIGVTSSIPGEGKTFTSINLAYSIAQTDKRVLLIEGDMRLPTIAKITKLDPSPGLSNLLVGLDQKIKVVQNYANKLHILVSGDVTSVSDALIVSQYVNGIIIVARQNYAYKKSFAETVRQLEQVNAKILGVVFNASHESSSGYGKKYKKYGKHYMAYYKTYQKAYEDAERR